MDKAAIIEEACNALSNGSLELCKSIITSQYPFQNLKKKRTPIPKSTALRIFVRDGFIDRYSGAALIFPGTLRIISELMPDVFPYHPHGRLDLCHHTRREISQNGTGCLLGLWRISNTI